MSLPSNFSVEEVVKYGNMPEDVRTSISGIFDTIISLEGEINDYRRNIELLEEENTNLRNFAEVIMDACKKYTKCKDLKEAIEVSFSNNSIEI